MSDAELHQRVTALFARAEDLPHRERASFLLRACGDDAELRREVESMLASLDAMDGFLGGDTPGDALAAADLPPSPTTTAEHELPDADWTLGKYRIVRQLGQGGMGTVHEAVQETTQLRVALKVLAPGMVSDEGVRRFEREAKLLARFQHPGIAQVVDAGTAESPSGAPVRFFAMELVDGRPLTEQADALGLDLRRRLELVAEICDAVDHAHEQGVIHRDLKPANILVDADGRPKVLDFGVARSDSVNDTALTVATRTGTVLGTLCYMSPEQASGSEVDERTDVFALGVIAFELLSGALPHDMGGLSFPEALRVLLDGETERLAARLPSTRGDVDAIVTKAMERDPARRYPSASAMAADIRRHLLRQPIRARPLSVSYRAFKFTSRHPALVATTALVLVALAASLAREHSRSRRETAAARRASWGEYRARLSLAGVHLQQHDASAVIAALEGAPTELRGWEWELLRAEADQASSVTDLASLVGGDMHLHATADEIFAGGKRGAVSLNLTTGNVRPLARTEIWMFLAGPRMVSWERQELRVVHLTTGDSMSLPCPARPYCIATNDSELVVSLHSRGLLVIDPVRRVSSTLFTDRAWDRPAVSKDGVIVSFERDSGRLWADGLLAAELDDSAEVLVMAASDDRVFLGWERGTTAHDVRTGEQLPWGGEPLHHEAHLIAVSPDGRRLAVIGDGQVSLVDATDGSLVASLGASVRERNAVFFTDGDLLATLGRRHEIRVHSARDGRELRTLSGHRRNVTAVVFARDGELLVSGDQSGEVRTWDLRGEGSRRLRGHSSYVYGVDVSPDGARLASVGWEGTTRLWDLASGELLSTFHATREGPATVAFSPDGTRLASSNEREVNVWDLGNGDLLLRQVEEPAEHADLVHRHVEGLRWDATGRRLASFGQGLPLRERALPRSGVATASGSRARTLLPLAAGAEILDLSPSWSSAVIGDGETARVVLLETGEVTSSLDGHAAPIHRALFRNGGKWLITTDDAWVVRLWDLDEGAMIQSYRGHSEKVYDAILTADLSRLVTAGNDDVIRIWHREGGHELVALEDHDDYVHALAFSPDGRVLVSGSGDGTIRLWASELPAEARE